MTEAVPQRVVAVVPCLDEEGNIATVTTGLFDFGVDSVVVVDNGSTDNTAREAASAGATVISEPRRGYGYACAAGTAAAKGDGAEVIVYIDGDQSSRPSEVPALVAPIIDGSARLVLGSRTLGTVEAGAMPPHQRFGNWLTALLMRLLYRVEVTDLGPFRAIDAALIGELDMREMTFGWPTEMMVKAARRHDTIVEIPASWDRRAEGDSKVGGTLRGSALAAYHILRVTFRYAVPVRPSPDSSAESK